jgi:hypothetical protein
LAQTSREPQVHERGQAQIQDERQTPNRRAGKRQGVIPLDDLVITGILVDGGCVDRSSLNLRWPADGGTATTPSQPAEQVKHQEKQATPAKTGSSERVSTGSLDAKGVAVTQTTANNERNDVLRHLTPDLRTRQGDPMCAITGSTRGFALLMANGRLVDLDEGGNTYAMQAVMSDSAGRAMMNGEGPPIKPRTEVKGKVRGDRLIVSELKLVSP